jgi:hypothetical protein
MSSYFYDIGTPGTPWGNAERALWLGRQHKLRSYADSIERELHALAKQHSELELLKFASSQYGNEQFAHWALKSKSWNPAKPGVLVTGGVHGYETSGVHGALQFLRDDAARFLDKVNLLIIPCVSPWAYERIHRWNAEALDPNRNFKANSPAQESAAVLALLASIDAEFLLHIDLHETTDTDESEYRPALAARDGKSFEPGEIPDGFYLVADTPNPQLAFQAAIIDAVAKITHIAEPDAAGEIIGSTVLAHGVIAYPFDELGLCPSATRARYKTTTEVYPDSPRATAEQCNAAQAAAVCAAIEFVLR